jgi:hypothetical protein
MKKKVAPPRAARRLKVVELSKKPGPKSGRPSKKHSLEKLTPFRLVAKSSVRQKYEEAARILFVEQGLSCRQIADEGTIPVRRSTLGKWMRQGGWIAQREALRTSPQARVSDLELALRTLIDELKKHAQSGRRPWKGAFDDILKGVRAIEAMRGDIYFAGHLVKVLELLKTYLEVSKREELLRQTAELLPGFVSWALSGKR